MGRFLTHLALTTALMLVPALRVLCDGSCAPEASPMAETTVASDATPECHSHQSIPESDSMPQDDCTHGDESSAASLSAWVKSGSADGPKVSVIATVAMAHLSVISSDVRRDTSWIPSAGQRLGLFLTPLRI